MDIMYIYHNHEDLHQMFDKTTVRIVTNYSELAEAIARKNQGLCLEEFRSDIPTMTRVERFERRASLTGPGEHGNDYVFINSWMAPVSRAKALEALTAEWGPIL